MMDDAQIKDILTKFVYAEMKALDDSHASEEEIEYSKSYQKRIKKMMWSEQYFGKWLHIGYGVRRIAMIGIVILGLFAGGRISASLIGVNPWEYTLSYLREYGMDKKTYIEQTDTEGKSDTSGAVASVPDYIPAQYSRKESLINDFSTYICWMDDVGHSIRYMSYELDNNAISYTDAECNIKEPVNINDYAGYYYKKDAEAVIRWADEGYSYTITTDDADIGKEELIRIGESMSDV